ncbi:MAG: S-layer homology domain-containing protein, partial [Oscillospiraceae bacterium]|nr:S-layer homology domain-containing protein [Oscillospiraceae bacterium]
ETRTIKATGHNYESVVTEPTCTERGYTTHTCAACGHSYVDSYVSALGHEYGEWHVVTAATCTEDGVEQRDCVRCEHYETRTIKATGHNYESVVTEPTCTERGYTTHTCANCGESYVDSEVEALGHDFGEWYVVEPGTCLEAGEARRDCRRCEHSESMEIRKNCPSEPYTDVDQSKWYHLYVDYVIETGLMIGYDADTFGPNDGTTRAMIATVLYRMEGAPEVSGQSPYKDVAEGKWYTDAITWADSVGVVLGYGDGNFGPDDKLTREQMIVIFYRFAKYKGYDTTITADLSSFTDGNTVSAWAKEAVCWGVSCGMIEGMDNGRIEPKGGATRAQIAKILWFYSTTIAGK